jgi:hypothetical protein
LGGLQAAPDSIKLLHSIFSCQTPQLQKLQSHQIHGSSSQLHQIHRVPQGVLCEGWFRTHSWSWVEITHLSHPLHIIPVRLFFFPPSPRDLSRRAPLTSSNRIAAAACSPRRLLLPAGKRRDVASACSSPDSAWFFVLCWSTHGKGTE